MYFAYGTKETDYLSRKDKRLAAAIAQIGPIEREVDTDLFAAVVLGALLNGRALADACALAGEFVKDCIAYTAAQHTDPMHGVQFEKLLPRLFSCHENQTEV